VIVGKPLFCLFALGFFFCLACIYSSDEVFYLVVLVYQHLFMMLALSQRKKGLENLVVLGRIRYQFQYYEPTIWHENKGINMLCLFEVSIQILFPPNLLCLRRNLDRWQCLFLCLSSSYLCRKNNFRLMNYSNVLDKPWEV